MNQQDMQMIYAFVAVLHFHRKEIVHTKVGDVLRAFHKNNEKILLTARNEIKLLFDCEVKYHIVTKAIEFYLAPSQPIEE